MSKWDFHLPLFDCWGGDGHWFVAVEERIVNVYDISTRELAFEVELDQEGGLFLPVLYVTVSSRSRLAILPAFSGELRLLDLTSQNIVQRYGRRGFGFPPLEAVFGGMEDEFIIHGSLGKTNLLLRVEDVANHLLVAGAVHVWDRRSGILASQLEGHSPSSVTAVAWNSGDACMMASAGSDGKVKM